ncbi:MAG TPA: zinc-binding alcohol dehydrogenase [Pseudolabrys sp.]|nr:zinc-binding alcohol dehydrogenase [Pseudolabrys sp.]
MGVAETAQALWYVAPSRAEIREEPLGELPSGVPRRRAEQGSGAAENMVRVRALWSALSRGTEALVFAGRVPASEHQRMRAPFMTGEFPFPVKYGYAAVGRAESGALAGRNVFVLHPHQTCFDVPEAAVVPLPDTVPPARAVLAANMETALNAVWDAAEGPFKRIAVVGVGVVGALTGYLLRRMTKADVTFVDINPARAEIAKAFDARFALPEAAKGDCDLVVHASASAAGLATAIGLAAEEATILELSWYGEGSVPVPLGGAFHSRRLKLVASQVGKVALSRRAKVTHRQRLEQAIGLLDDARLDILLAPPTPFRELPARLPQILAPGSGVLCQPVAYS